MNDLPAPTQGTTSQSTSDTAMPQSGAAVGGIGGKEKEFGATVAETVRPAGVESELSSEVAASGVKIQPTSIPIPASVAQMGVKAAGQNVATAAPTIALPLSDDQIAQGLKQGVWSSWRWLAEWCVRKLKQLHMSIRSIGGRGTRVRT